MRKCAVSGQFYPARKQVLMQELEDFFSDMKMLHDKSVKGIVVPHAGYVYSGHTAAYGYARIPVADTFILIGPNHTGYGQAVSVSVDTWDTPLGSVESDLELIAALGGGVISHDEDAHVYEHSLEVQLPFLKKVFSHDFKVVMICMGLQDKGVAAIVGNKIADAILQTGRNTAIIASSDFSHYIDASTAKRIDLDIIDSITNLDVDGMYRKLSAHNASMCGYGPVATMLIASKKLGATEGKLLHYSNSGDVTGDMTAVVGYGAIAVS